MTSTPKGGRALGRFVRPRMSYRMALSVGVVSQIVTASSAFACGSEAYACQPTYLCFADWAASENGCWGRFAGTNGDWGDYGWRNRADWFENHGTRCNARVYGRTWYQGYTIAFLERGEVENPYPYNNDAESNTWYSCK
jgi:hypothetical protein